LNDYESIKKKRRLAIPLRNSRPNSQLTDAELGPKHHSDEAKKIHLFADAQEGAVPNIIDLPYW
jgi:hypothetical protein